MHALQMFLLYCIIKGAGHHVYGSVEPVVVGATYLACIWLSSFLYLPYLTLLGRQCRLRHYVFGLSVRRIHSFFRTDLVTTISYEQLKQSR